MSLQSMHLKTWGIEVSTIEATLERALHRGGSWAELFFERTESTRVMIEGGKLDRMQEGVDQGVGLRLVSDLRTLYGYTTDLSPESLLRLADQLSQAVTHEKPGVLRKDWRGQKQAKDIADYQIQKDPRAIGLTEKADLCWRIERAARRQLPEARQVLAVVMDSKRETLVVNSDGSFAYTPKTYFQMVCQVVAEKAGRVETAYETDGGFVGLEFLETRPPEEIGREAASRVAILLNAVPAPAGTMPVVLSAEAGGTMIHEAVGHGLEADLACNGLSVYQDKLGELVASPLVSVMDDGTMKAMRGSYSYDDEGTPSNSTALIENGILKSYMVDRLSAMKFDLSATGNGRRESFRHKPIVRMTNTYIRSGTDDPTKILADTEWGVFVKAMGGGQVNTVTGDFVFAVTEGYLIEKGKLTQPIRGATLVGNGPKVLKEVDRVGNDLGFSTGTCGKDGQGAPVTDGQPTLRIPELTVGGEVPPGTYWPPR